VLAAADGLVLHAEPAPLLCTRQCRLPGHFREQAVVRRTKDFELSREDGTGPFGNPAVKINQKDTHREFALSRGIRMISLLSV
jgi:hypothetical protein